MYDLSSYNSKGLNTWHESSAPFFPHTHAFVWFLFPWTCHIHIWQLLFVAYIPTKDIQVDPLLARAIMSHLTLRSLDTTFYLRCMFVKSTWKWSSGNFKLLLRHLWAMWVKESNARKEPYRYWLNVLHHNTDKETCKCKVDVCVFVPKTMRRLFVVDDCCIRSLLCFTPPSSQCSLFYLVS